MRATSSPLWRRRKRAKRNEARTALLDPHPIPTHMFVKHISLLNSHHGSQATDLVELVLSSRRMPKSWNCGKCGWSIPDHAKGCVTCSLSKGDALAANRHTHRGTWSVAHAKQPITKQQLAPWAKQPDGKGKPGSKGTKAPVSLIPKHGKGKSNLLAYQKQRPPQQPQQPQLTEEEVADAAMSKDLTDSITIKQRCFFILEGRRIDSGSRTETASLSRIGSSSFAADVFKEAGGTCKDVIYSHQDVGGESGKGSHSVRKSGQEVAGAARGRQGRMAVADKSVGRNFTSDSFIGGGRGRAAASCIGGSTATCSSVSTYQWTHRLGKCNYVHLRSFRDRHADDSNGPWGSCVFLHRHEGAASSATTAIAGAAASSASSATTAVATAGAAIHKM